MTVPTRFTAPPDGADLDDVTEATLLDALAVHAPSWGGSVVLHVALVVLGLFVSLTTYVEADPFVVPNATAAPNPNPRTENRPDPPEWGVLRSYGRLRPQPSFLTHHPTNPFQDVAPNRLPTTLNVIGVGGGGGGLGGFEGLRSTGPIFLDPDFVSARKVVYVVDRSGSMTDSIDFVKLELKRAIGLLAPEQEFHVLFYSAGPPLEMPTRRLVAATAGNRRHACAFIDGVITAGPTDPSEALVRAFAVRPEVVYLLSDGEFDRGIIDHVGRLNAEGRVTVHTIGFLYEVAGPVLKEIAARNGGNYKFVAEEDLAGLVQ